MNPRCPTVLLAAAIALAVSAADARAQQAAAKAAQPTQAEILSALDAAARCWDSSCPRADSHGFCAAHKTVKGAQRCGGQYDRVTLKRNAKRAVRGEAALRKAMAAYDAAPSEVQSGLGLDAAKVCMRLADVAAERVLALAFPTDLDFSMDDDEVRKASTERFKRWVADIQNAYKEAREGYVAAAKLARGTPLASAAKKRAVAITLAFADTLEHGYIPKDVRSPPYKDDKTMAFCDELANQAAPLRAAAKAYSAP